MLQTATAESKRSTAAGNSRVLPEPQALAAPPVTRLGNQALLRLQRKCHCGGASDYDFETEPDHKKEQQAPRTALHRKPAGAPSVLDPASESFFQARAESRTPSADRSPIRIGAVDDPLEHEADQMADRVLGLRAIAPAPEPSPGHAALTQPLRRRQTSASAPGEAPPIVHEILRSSGQPLDGPTRSFFESRFGADLDSVRIHTGAHAADSARSVAAQAYTVGSQIVFGAGLYAPHSDSGRRLLAHELAHVVQHQRAGSSNHPPSPHGSISRAPAAQGNALRRQAVPGGNILYVGMNNYKPEVDRLKALYAGRPVNVTTVTVTEGASKTQVGGSTFDLTTDDGIKQFVASLNLPDTADADKLKALIGAQGNEDRDDLAHVIAVYAKTQADQADRMSRVVLSGHSYGSLIYNEDVKGEIQFASLVTLAGIFPKAAAQTRHLLVLACLAGEKDTIQNYYLKAFPNLQTFWGWTRATCPTGAGAANALEKWSRLTDKNPTEMPLPPEHQATWAAGNYQTNDPVDATALMAQIRGDEPNFNQYFVGVKTDSDAHSGFLFEYYQRARTAALHTSEITGVDHDYAQLHADQSYRLRFWPGMVSNFWKTFGTAIQAGYGSSKPPDYAHLNRKDALAAVANFPSATTAADRAAVSKAQQLLDALKNLDANVLHGDWIKA
jgi:hypothetical protein